MQIHIYIYIYIYTYIFLFSGGCLLFHTAYLLQITPRSGAKGSGNFEDVLLLFASQGWQ